MSLSAKVQIALEIQKGIREAEDELVEAIEKALDAKKYGNLEESQFRNLVRVAETTDSPEVIKNFIRYQVGRDNKWGRGKDSLAETIINDIDIKIKKLAEKIVDKIENKSKEKAEQLDNKGEITKIKIEAEDQKLIQIELIRRYLGYGARYLKYLREGKV